MPRRETFTGLALLVAGVAVALAQEQAAEPIAEETFFEQIQINLVNVDIVATTKRGDAVLDLTQEDFEVFEDGKPVAVRNFSLVERTSPSQPAAVELEEIETETSEHPLTFAGPPTRLIVFIDHFNSTAQERNDAIDTFLDMADRILPTVDSAMVVAFSRGLHLVQPATNDRALITAALEEQKKVAGDAKRAESDRDLILRKLVGSTLTESQFSPRSPELEADSVLQDIRSFADREADRSRVSISALEDFSRALGGLDGRKLILYFSDGLRKYPGEGLYMAWESKFERFKSEVGFSNAATEARLHSVENEFNGLISVANANRVTFYTLDTGGNRVFNSISAEQGNLDLSSMDSAAVRPWDSQNDAVVAFDHMTSLGDLAEGTGGRLLANKKKYENSLGRMVADIDTFYSLGYEAPHFGDGKRHKIEVKVERKGVNLRHRTSYVDHSPEQRAANELLSALIFGISNNPVGMRLELGDIEERGDEWVVPVQVRVPIANLLLMPNSTHHQGRIDVMIASRDDRGRVRPFDQQPMPISIPNEQVLTALGQDAGYRTNLVLPKGEQRLVVGVRDTLAAQNSMLLTELPYVQSP